MLGQMECEKDRYFNIFSRRHIEAVQEHERLKTLFREACWYNFEVQCRTWQYPWPQTIESSQVLLHGQRYETKNVKGVKHEYSSFPIYYIGQIKDAPELPLQILINELRDSSELESALEEQVTAPYDWAPGGVMYNILKSKTTVGKE